MTIRKKHKTQEGILIDRINDALNTSDIEIPQHSLMSMNLMSILVLAYLMVSIYFTFIYLPFQITLIN